MTSDLNSSTDRILGMPFFNGTAPEAVEYFLAVGGLLVAPASPALMNLKYDAEYRRAMQAATIAVPDSTLLTVAWKVASGRSMKKISGLNYLKSLLVAAQFRKRTDTLWLVSSERTQTKSLSSFQSLGYAVGAENVHVIPDAVMEGDRYDLLTEIERRTPTNIVIALSRGVQEKLGSYLREYVMHKPNIHCVGATLGFLIGDERPIPGWAERLGIAWFIRLASQPTMILPRIGIGSAVTSMVLRYKSEMPPLQKRWADV